MNLKIKNEFNKLKKVIVHNADNIIDMSMAVCRESGTHGS